MTKILIVDDEKPICDVLSASLRDDGYRVETAGDGESGLMWMKDFQPEIVLLDIWMPGSLDGLQVLELAKQQFPEMQFIIMSGHGTIETADKAVKHGAWDFVEKPLSMDKISNLIKNILTFKKEQIEKTTLLNHLRRNLSIVGESPLMVSLKQMIARIAPTDSWVLLSGEHGTGKELVAQNIHYMSPKAGRPFVEVNCAAIPKELLESDLFGYEIGAFAGADKPKKGKFEHAFGGTLFLDEISNTSLEVQEKILRVLQEKQFRRVGGTEPIAADVRVIASTHINLEDAVKDGRFREDLYYRLNAVPFRMPPLRQRKEDIVLLVDYFGDQFGRHGGYRRKVFSEGAIQHMHNYPWAGNVRELRNFVERVYILTPSDVVDTNDIKFAGLVDSDEAEVNGLATFREARAHFEKEFLERKISENGGNISKTAEAIGLERSYLHRKIKSYGIDI